MFMRQKSLKICKNWEREGIRAHKSCEIKDLEQIKYLKGRLRLVPG